MTLWKMLARTDSFGLFKLRPSDRTFSPRRSAIEAILNCKLAFVLDRTENRGHPSEKHHAVAGQSRYCYAVFIPPQLLLATLPRGGIYTLSAIRNLTVAALLSATAGALLAHADDDGRNNHVLLISIDGMHAVDYEICVKNNTCPTMAKRPAVPYGSVSGAKNLTFSPRLKRVFSRKFLNRCG
jgi:hypothetical protein